MVGHDIWGRTALLSATLLVACPSEGGEQSSAGESGGSGVDPSADAGDSADGGGTADTTADGGGGNGDGDGDGGTSSAGTATSQGDGETGGDGGSTSDSGGSGDETGDTGACGGPGDGQDYDFSIIWVSNTGEGTMSKIDTFTGTELARYRTGDGNESPSRTSVNLRGDVVVGNRNGSVAKFATRLEDCIDRNNNGTIETSSGPDDVLDWQQDECWIWYHDVEFAGGNGGPRAIAWDSGENYLEDPCNPGQARVWVGWRNQPNDEVLIRRLRGDTGEIDNEVLIPDWDGNWGHGTYGGATDAQGNFWGLGTLGTIVKVDAVTFQYTRWDNPENNVVYGIALDAQGNPWLAGWNGELWKFDVATETFIDMGASGGSRLRGLAIDSNGMAWAAANNPCGLAQYDIVNEQSVQFIALENCSEPVGVSIDAEDYVWVVDRGADRAYKVHPQTYDYTQVLDLVDPYTYSDMTGAGLELVVVPQ